MKEYLFTVNGDKTIIKGKNYKNAAHILREESLCVLSKEYTIYNPMQVYCYGEATNPSESAIDGWILFYSLNNARFRRAKEFRAN